MVPLISSIENEFLRVQASSVGAELQSVVLKQDGTEFLWQGDPTYWKGRAYNLFPICGRLWEGKYTYAGKTYEMNLHGFARKSEMTLAEKTADSMTFRLEDSEKTLAQYPFKFVFTVSYHLEGSSLKVTLGVENKDEKTMIFAVGGHPGYNVPFGGKGDFTDYELEFDNPGHVKAVAMSTACYATEHFTMMPLEGGRRMPLRHEFFDNDAVVLTDMGPGVTLRPRSGGHTLHMSFPDMKYLGVWHSPKSEAPFLCLEPWRSLPAEHGKIDALETKRDMLTLESGKHYDNTWVLTLK
jgi:galactose mutarotase-like enzyme